MTKQPPNSKTSDSRIDRTGVPERMQLTPLNFKVTPEFHRDFKIFAVKHGKKMVEVLQEAFVLVKEKYGK